MAKARIEPEERVRMHKDNAVKELDLMHKAIEAGDYKKAMHHKIVANIAIDEMVNVSRLVEESDGKKNG
ncbi:hypothetical protein [Candidatus Nitrososphaera sp. FF02]|jgi:hypothetical protein|uniref:hypothetical protein n=1 Tax=Candidatus Nitrososphaera sp. FF02 TaxID=3398226 RepID=UPI0039ED84DC